VLPPRHPQKNHSEHRTTQNKARRDNSASSRPQNRKGSSPTSTGSADALLMLRLENSATSKKKKKNDDKRSAQIAYVFQAMQLRPVHAYAARKDIGSLSFVYCDSLVAADTLM
jgi:hypothetical protein